ncbi:MAG: hypothetical protein GX988_02845 [Clostridiales bacterium]|nr:hypothetical protein [Clostridiales bacterium]
MQISEYLRLRNQISVTTGKTAPNISDGNLTSIGKPQESPFADILKEEIYKQTGGVEFSKHAIARLDQREIDLSEGHKLERLNKGVELAQQKGSEETLVLVDSTAFVVSVKNNRVITMLSNEDLEGNVFTNIDSTVII